MRFHYFDLDSADPNDLKLKMSISQGYVPSTCLLAGMVVWDEIQRMNDPCAGCNGPRERCKGRPKK